MSGHSKWANIKHRKGAQDAKRSKVFQKLSTEIMVAIKEHGNDPETNARLRLAIEKAKAQNMPNTNIDKLLKTKSKDGGDWKELTYEGYGPKGVAILVSCLTDNTNRTSATVGSNFNKNGGNLGTGGSVSYLFERKGIIAIDKETISNQEQVMEIALLEDALDIKEEDNIFIIETIPTKLLATKKAFEDVGIVKFISTEISMVPTVVVDLDEPSFTKLEKIVDALEDNDDVQAVYTNAV